MQLKPGLYQSGSFHPASQTKLGLPPAVRMLYWLPPSISAKTKKQQTSNKGRWVLRSGRGQLRETRSTSAAPPAVSRSTYLLQTAPTQILQHSPTWHSLIEVKYREDTRMQKQLSAAQEQHKGLCSTFMSLRFSPHHLFGSGWHHLHTTITHWSLLRSWVLILKELGNCFQASCSF